MTPTETPPEVLRRTAELIRHRAADCCDEGPWEAVDDVGTASIRPAGDDPGFYLEVCRTDQGTGTVDHLLSWPPAVVLPLAAWLDDLARRIDRGAPEAEDVDGALAFCHAFLSPQRPTTPGYVVVKDDPRHLLELADDGWTLQHSLRCRLDGTLFDCPTNRAVSTLMAEGDTGERGFFEVTVDAAGTAVIGARCEQ